MKTLGRQFIAKKGHGHHTSFQIEIAGIKKSFVWVVEQHSCSFSRWHIIS